MISRNRMYWVLGQYSLALLGIAVLAALSVPCAADETAIRGGHFTTSDGVRLHYLEAGKGPALVFIPGWMMPGEIWDPQIRHFARNYQVVALDPRSQGESERPSEGHYPERRARDIRELIEHLKLSNVVLVGWSLGVGEVLTYAREFGTADLHALVLVDAFLSDPDKASVERWRGMFTWLKTMQTDRRKWTEDFVRNMYAKPHPEAYVKRITEMALRTPTSSAFALIGNVFAQADWRPAAAKIDRPVLFVCQASSKASAELFQSVLPATRVETLDGVGHALFVDDPERFNSIVDDFVRNLGSKESEL
ncbi:MAG: alpha/beta fold hydrolase [Terriglobales bacterium]